jgi:hypothetical protein
MRTPRPSPARPRAERYRQFAAHTQRIAETIQSREIRATYLSLAQCWRTLADHAERLGRDFPEDMDGEGDVEADAGAYF